MIRIGLRLTLLVTLLFQTACASRVPVDVYPIHQPSERVKPKDKITIVLREEMERTGRVGADPQDGPTIVWKTKELTGELAIWEKDQIIIQVPRWRAAPKDPPQAVVFTIPIDQVDRVDSWPGFKPTPLLTTIGSLVLVIGITIAIAAAVSKPSAN